MTVTDFEPKDLVNRLIPTLRPRSIPVGISHTEYGRLLVDHCRQNLSAVLPLNSAEKMFLDLLLDDGTIDGSLLTEDTELKQRIESHPLLQWKALNVRQHKGLEQET